jgi:hypothetical protein
LDLAFTGDDISSQVIDFQPEFLDIFGDLISVPLHPLSVPDLRTVTLSVVLPWINLEDPNEATPFSTVAILTTHHTSVGGPPLVKGPRQTYEIVPLEGMASLMVS